MDAGGKPPAGDNAHAGQPAAGAVARQWRRLTGGRLAKDAQRPTLVACSGGADSTALLLALARAAPEQVVAGHVVHDLRPPDQAEGDAACVERLARRLGVRFARTDVRVRASPGNPEAAARRARYGALERLATDLGCLYVATGHHGDDQLETILMRLVRGAGPRGLAGIAPRRPLGRVVLVRPMLAVSRADAEAICLDAGVPWALDATNADTSRWRARLRAHVLPVLRDLRPDVHRRSATAAGLLREAAELLEGQAAALIALARRDAPGALVWERAGIDRAGEGVLGEVLRQARRELLEEAGADRLGAASVREIARGLADADRRQRTWTVAGLRVCADARVFRVERATQYPASPAS